MSQAEKGTSFTGRSRQRSTRRSVVMADRAARGLIKVGGIGTILAVLGVFLFLVWVVLPLFLPAKITDLHSLETRWQERPLHLDIDEYRLLGWVVLPSGQLEVFRLDDGRTLRQEQLFPESQLTSSSFLLGSDLAVFGFADGSIRTARLGFDSEVFDLDALSAEQQQALEAGERVVDHQDGVVEKTPAGQVRFQRLHLELDESTRVSSGPVRALGHANGPSGPRIAVLGEGELIVAAEPASEDRPSEESTTEESAAVDNDDPTSELAQAESSVPGTGASQEISDQLTLALVAGREDSNFLTGETSLAFAPPVGLAWDQAAAGLPLAVAVSGTGNDVFVAWPSGELIRIDAVSPESSAVVERARLVSDGATLQAMRFILGNNTLVWGDDRGRLRGGFLVRAEEFDGTPLAESWRDEERTEFLLVETKSLANADAGVLTVAPSSRTRLVLSGHEDGEVRLANVTHAAGLARYQLPDKQPIQALVMAPKEDGLALLTPGRLYTADLDPRYSEASFNALFRSVWYEGYPAPTHSWQSSSGTDDFEPKHGLMPLIFGTIKATVYSMLFGAPLALLAAIFTSEFLDRKVRTVVKPTIELMASLPSVVLGFLAALVFAPFVERVVPATLTAFVTLPVAFLVGAYVWQLLPTSLTLRLEGWRFTFLVLLLPIGVLAASLLGPLVESMFFGGDIMAWLAFNPAAGDPEQAARYASSTGGWLLLCLPLSALLVALAQARLAGPTMRNLASRMERQPLALADGARFLISALVAVLLALVIAVLLDRFGFDPRGSYIDTYVQRNALIVGFVMGFAIIPIIYTLSEDALSTVPEHLRSASLGAGATPWQTAVRIIMPTAMSGLFSALMIGLGRAVGETMIVLMAAGNTPVMEWNIFEGFRTLSANIAVELPEAVKGSTHYRTLFLAALVLFAMTFVVNTVAEIVRLRFRKRAYQL